jgi:NADH-quinone oxidoreductase subunit N
MQTNLKRLLAYSTISHIGFICLALMMMPDYGVANALFYTIIYMLTTLAAFGVMLVLSRQGFEADQISDLKGLGNKSPWLALVMLMVVFSLAGIPPLAGFYAKFLILKNLIVFQQFGLPLAIFALIMSVIAGFYYLRIIKVMYFEQADEHSHTKISCGMHASGMLILGSNAFLLLLLGILPNLILTLCFKAL